MPSFQKGIVQQSQRIAVRPDDKGILKANQISSPEIARPPISPWSPFTGKQQISESSGRKH